METFCALLALCAGNSPDPVNSPHKGQWRRALMFSFICAWINNWANNGEAGDLRRHRGHYDVGVMCIHAITCSTRPIVGFRSVSEVIVKDMRETVCYQIIQRNTTKPKLCIISLDIRLLYALFTWWRHDMGTLSTLIALCDENPPVTKGQPAVWRIDVFFAFSLKKMSKNSRVAGILTSRRPCYITVMPMVVYTGWRHQLETFGRRIHRPPNAEYILTGDIYDRLRISRWERRHCGSAE